MRFTSILFRSWLSRTTLVLLCTVALLACEKDTLGIDQETNPVDSEVPALKLDLHASVNQNVALSDLDFTVVDGLLSFPTATAYREATYAVTKSNKQDYLNWVESTGIVTQQSEWLRLLRLRDDSEITDDQLESLLTPKTRSYLEVRDETIIPKLFGQVSPYLINEDGYLMIGGGLHEFTSEHHIYVADGKAETLAKVRLSGQTNFEVGEIFQPNELVYLDDGKSDGTSDEYAKVQVRSYSCPHSHFSNPVNVAGMSAFTLTDEQRVDNIRHRMTSAYARGALILSGSPPGRDYEVQWSSTTGYTNERRQTFWPSWRTTDATVQVDYTFDEPGNGTPLRTTDELVVSRWAAAIVNGSVEHLPFDSGQSRLNQPITNDGDIPFIDVDSDTNVIILDDITATMTSVRPGTLTEVVFQYVNNDGTISLRWTDVGDNTSDDPISCEYRCQ